jgi:hypothetical protein
MVYVDLTGICFFSLLKDMESRPTPADLMVSSTCGLLGFVYPHGVRCISTDRHFRMVLFFRLFLFGMIIQQHGYLLVQEKVDLQQWAKEMI